MRAIIFCTIFLLSLSGCIRTSDGGTVPRRYAYPRIADLDSATTQYRTAGLTLNLNAQAIAETDRDGWITAAYPSLGATLYLSATRPGNTEEMQRAIANRRQRISLNLGGVRTRTDRFATSAGLDCEMAVSYDGTATPVQFIACNDGKLVSGAFVLSGSTMPADSLRPIIDAIEKEAFAIVNSITPCR